MTAAAAVPHWSHVALNCTDPAVTEDFYRRWFGFHRARVVPLGDSEIVFLRSGEVYLELFHAEGDLIPGTGDGPRRPGVARHLAFQSADVDVFLARLDSGVTVSLGPISFDDVLPGWRSVWLLDPDGVVVEVSQGYHDQHPHELGGAVT